MDSPTLAEDSTPIFYVGQHETARIRVTPQLLRQAQDCSVSCKEEF